MMYILFDTALNGLYSLNLIQKAYPGNLSLFKGTKDEHLFDVAPYIFSIDDRFFYNINDPYILLDAIVVVESDLTTAALQNHFQQFIYQKKEGQQNYFRFWDARVLLRFLSNSSYNQLNLFFDEITSFYIPNKENLSIVRYSLKRGKMQSDILPLDKLFFLGNDIKEIKSAVETNEKQKTERTFFK